MSAVGTILLSKPDMKPWALKGVSPLQGSSKFSSAINYFVVLMRLPCLS